LRGLEPGGPREQQEGLAVLDVRDARRRRDEGVPTDRQDRRGAARGARATHDLFALGAGVGTLGREGLSVDDDAHDRESAAVRTPPVFVVEHVDERRAVDARAQAGLQRRAVGCGRCLGLGALRFLGGPLRVTRLGVVVRRGDERGLRARLIADGRPQRDDRRGGSPQHQGDSNDDARPPHPAPLRSSALSQSR
jgi:hypothetical protein